MSTELSASEQIDNIIKGAPGWRGETLAKLRAILLQAEPALVEEVKWKKPSKPEGVAVWSCNGNVCMADILKSAVRLTFPKGSQVHDPHKVFNTRLDGKLIRAVDFYEDSAINDAALAAIVIEAAQLNT